MKTTYPKVLTESATFEAALKGKSLARLGDGELKILIGGGCIFQQPDPILTSELQKVVIDAGKNPDLLVCLPRLWHGAPVPPRWERFLMPEYTRYMIGGPYGSAFVSRLNYWPEGTQPKYWDDIAALWRDRDVVIVRGSDKSLRKCDAPEAASVEEIMAPAANAYTEVPRLEFRLRNEKRRVLLALGPAATILAARLSRHGVQAIDMGSMGGFWRTFKARRERARAEA